MSRLTVLLLDDHELLRLGVRTVLQAQPALMVVGEAATIEAAVERVATLRPTLAITAAILPDGDAAEACRRITARSPGTKVAVLTTAEHVEVTPAGVAGCLSVDMRAADLCRAVRAIASGESWLGPPSTRPRRPPPGRTGRVQRDVFLLTAQERRVLALVTEGKTNKEIGLALALSQKTVKNYLSNVFEKLRVSRRAHAAVLFARGQRLDPSSPSPGIPHRMLRAG